MVGVLRRLRPSAPALEAGDRGAEERSQVRKIHGSSSLVLQTLSVCAATRSCTQSRRWRSWSASTGARRSPSRPSRPKVALKGDWCRRGRTGGVSSTFKQFARTEFELTTPRKLEVDFVEWSLAGGFRGHVVTEVCAQTARNGSRGDVGGGLFVEVWLVLDGTTSEITETAREEGSRSTRRGGGLLQHVHMQRMVASPAQTDAIHYIPYHVEIGCSVPAERKPL